MGLVFSRHHYQCESASPNSGQKTIRTTAGQKTQSTCSYVKVPVHTLGRKEDDGQTNEEDEEEYGETGA